MSSDFLFDKGQSTSSSALCQKNKGDLYQWHIGHSPPILGEHSLAKHRIIRQYLEKYVSILTNNPRVEQLTLSLVDGFSGGGCYRHPENMDQIPGSPLLMLEAMALAEVEANARRRNGFKLNDNYYFVEAKPQTMRFLENEVSTSRFAAAKLDRIHFLQGEFSSHIDGIVANIKRKGSAHRAIFLLDQYGYTDVPFSCIRKIFAALPNAEVILTFAVDWLTHFVNETERFTQALRNLELEDKQQLLVELRLQHSADWRAKIQRILHQHFFSRSGAEFYTPFFIHSVESNRAYWLLHFSKHSTARDAMTELHWEMRNHFEHFGGPGFGMLGYDPGKICTEVQTTFAFDQDAQQATTAALLCEVPRKLADHNGFIPYRDFFNLNVNDTPATKQMLGSCIVQLTRDKEVEVFTFDKKERRPGVQLRDTDLIRLPQTSFFPMW